MRRPWWTPVALGLLYVRSWQILLQKSVETYREA
jgi:hypothetical protein